MIRFCVMALLILIPGSAWPQECDADRGFLVNPPVYFSDTPDVPVTDFKTALPPPGATSPDFDVIYQESQGWKDQGEYVQPALKYKSTTYRLGVERAFNGGWSAKISIPYKHNRVAGAIAGLSTYGKAYNLSAIAIFGRKRLLDRGARESMVATLGIDLPTGRDRDTFVESNTATNAYYVNYPRRMPLGWQPSTGTTNGYLALAYGRKMCRLSWEAILAGKFFSAGDEDVKCGNIFVFDATGTYGVARNLALSLGLTYIDQSDDSYPNAPITGADALSGVTQHGSTLYLEPSARLRLMGRLTVGFGLKCPMLKPESGMQPKTLYSIIFYPDMP